MRNICLIIAVLLTAVSCKKPEPKYIFNQGFIHGTIYHITYESPEGKDYQKEIEQEMHAFDQSLSTFQPESVISRINQNDPNVVTDHFFETCFKRAQKISKATDGAFDITVAPLVNAWGFGFKNKEQISQELIDSLLQTVGYNKVKLKGEKIIKENPNTMLDASAIAKGYSVDVIAQFLQKKGCKNLMVEIGGEVVARGKNNKGRWWRIGINKPQEDALFNSQDLHTIVSLKNKGLATSGNYRNFYVEGGKKYAHTIDPESGYPIQHRVLSSTVVAKDCMTADAYATSFMVMGLDKAKHVLAEHPELEAFFILSSEGENYEVYYTQGFKKFIVD
ncbi:FAD:protein FMN transferase [Puteibacter caeruleilacunae]|nr:FAD:protein FMN transferase [Puteibacter caeruleilacunae]